eukprot:tig00020563_g11369.t1
MASVSLAVAFTVFPTARPDTLLRRAPQVPLQLSVGRRRPRTLRCSAHADQQPSAAGPAEQPDSAPAQRAARKLADIPRRPVLDEGTGAVSWEFDGAVRASVLAVSDAAGRVQHVSFSRNGFEALRRAVFRGLGRARFYQVEHYYEKPTNFVLDAIQRQAHGSRPGPPDPFEKPTYPLQWLDELGEVPPGNGPERATWEEPIPIRERLTPSERAAFMDAEEEEEWRAVLTAAGERLLLERLQELEALGCREPFEADEGLLRRGLLDPAPRTATRCGPPRLARPAQAPAPAPGP